MKLGDLTKKLYQKDSKVEDRVATEDSYDATNQNQPKDRFDKIEQDILKDQGTVEPTEKENIWLKRKMVFFGVTVVAVLAGIALMVFAYYKFIGGAFLEEKVLVEIKGSEQVQSAEDATYKIRVVNKNRVALNNCKVLVGYPNEMILDKKDFLQVQGFNSVKADIGRVEAKGEKEFEISFRSFGPRDRQVYLNASLTYQPNNFSSDFEKSVQKSVMIKSSPISLTIVPIQQAASGELAQVEIIIKNDSTKQYGNLELRVDYPEGFTFTESDILPVKDDRIWNIGLLEAKDQKKVTLKGIVEGVPESLKKFVAVIGETRDDDKFLTFTEIEGSVKIVPSRVEIIQEISNTDKVYANSELTYTIRFKNTSDVALRDLVLTEYISSLVLDKAAIETRGGYYDSGKQAITWRAAQIPELKVLEPQREGKVSFTIKILENFPMNNENDKNFTVKSFVELESLDVNSPLWQNKKIVSPERVVKINSKLILGSKIAYNDSEIPNSGPTPPVVRAETTFTARLSLMNTSNDLKNVVLKTSLLPGVSWKNLYLPLDPGVEFNSRTNELVWKIGTLEAGTGFISPVRNLAFQIGLIASENQAGKNIDLINPIKIQGLDSFTGNKVEYDFSGISLHQVSDINGIILPAQ